MILSFIFRFHCSVFCLILARTYFKNFVDSNFLFVLLTHMKRMVHAFSLHLSGNCAKCACSVGLKRIFGILIRFNIKIYYESL